MNGQERESGVSLDDFKVAAKRHEALVLPPLTARDLAERACASLGLGAPSQEDCDEIAKAMRPLLAACLDLAIDAAIDAAKPQLRAIVFQPPGETAPADPSALDASAFGGSDLREAAVEALERKAAKFSASANAQSGSPSDIDEETRIAKTEYLSR